MSDKILVEYISTSDKMKADLKDLNKVQVEVDNTAKATNKTMQDGFKKTEVQAKSLKSQLKDLKAQLANATDPKEVERLAKATGKLSDQIQDASDQAKIFASESKFEQVGTAIGSIGQKLMSLDFEGAAQQSKLLLAASKGITFEDALQGAKDLGTTLLNVGKSLVNNPILMLAAVFVAIGMEAYGAAKALWTMNDNTKALTDSIKEQEKVVRGYKQAVQESYIKIAESLGTLTKAEAEQKRASLKNQAEQLSTKEKYNDKLKDILKEITGDEKTNIQELSLLAAQGNIQAVAQLKKYNQQKVKLQEVYNQESKALTAKGKAENVQVEIAGNILAAEESKKATAKLLADAKAENEKNAKAALDAQAKIDSDAKLLRDLRTQNISDDVLRQKAILTDKLTDDQKQNAGNDAILIELRKKYNAEILDIDVKQRQDRLKVMDETLNDAVAKVKAEAKAEADASADPAFSSKIVKKYKDIEDEKTKAAAEGAAERKAIEQASFQVASSLVSAIGQIAQNNFNQELIDLQTKTDEQTAALDYELEHKTITQEEYTRRKADIDKKAHDEEVKVKKKAFESQKQAAIIGATISMAQAIVEQLATGGTAGFILAALAAVTGAAQIAVIASQPTPQFAKGVVDLKGKGTGTSDEIHAMISKGESVITAKATSENKSLLIALNKGKGEEYLMKNLVAPALLQQKKRFMEGKDKSFADSLMKSMAINSKGMNDQNILEALKMNRRSDKQIAEYMVRELKGNSFNPRKW
jgi:hypothetical protein